MLHQATSAVLSVLFPLGLFLSACGPQGPTAMPVTNSSLNNYNNTLNQSLCEAQGMVDTDADGICDPQDPCPTDADCDGDGIPAGGDTDENDGLTTSQYLVWALVATNAILYLSPAIYRCIQEDCTLDDWNPFQSNSSSNPTASPGSTLAVAPGIGVTIPVANYSEGSFNVDCSPVNGKQVCTIALYAKASGTEKIKIGQQEFGNDSYACIKSSFTLGQGSGREAPFQLFGTFGDALKEGPLTIGAGSFQEFCSSAGPGLWAGFTFDGHLVASPLDPKTLGFSVDGLANGVANATKVVLDGTDLSKAQVHFSSITNADNRTLTFSPSSATSPFAQTVYGKCVDLKSIFADTAQCSLRPLFGDMGIFTPRIPANLVPAFPGEGTSFSLAN